MTNDLETLRQAVEAFGRRKNELSEDGKQALSRPTFNLKRQAETGGTEVSRKLLMDDIAIIEAELTNKREAT